MPATITTIAPGERTTLPGGLPGFLREQCFADDHAWVGMVSTEPGAASPWHHHGAYDTYAYLLEGEATVEFGEGGRDRVTLRADGSWLKLPQGVVHREINTGATTNRFIIFRVGEGPAVVPCDGPS